MERMIDEHLEFEDDKESNTEGYAKEKVKEIIKDLLTDISTGFDKLMRYPHKSDTDWIINQTVRMCETVVKNEVIRYLREEIENECYREP